MSVRQSVFDETVRTFLEPIATLLETSSVSEIMINGHDQIYVEERGQLRLTNCSFSSEYALMAALRNVSQYAGRELSERQPILEASLPDGSRVEAVIPPVSPVRPIVSIRRFSSDVFTIDRLTELGALAPRASRDLRHLVESKKNVLVAGPPGSGKTTLLGALATFFAPTERVVVIEDSTDLRLLHPHVVSLQTRAADAHGRGRVGHEDLLRAANRLRADRLVVGELRGGEAASFLSAISAGHRGCMATLDARSARDALARLERLARSSLDHGTPPQGAGLRHQIGAAVDSVLLTGWGPDGARSVCRIADVGGYDPKLGYQLRDRSAPMESQTGVAGSLS